jgi:hypothetical protein
MKRFDVGKSHGKLILLERMKGFVSVPGLTWFLLPAIQMKCRNQLSATGTTKGNVSLNREILSMRSRGSVGCGARRRRRPGDRRPCEGTQQQDEPPALIFREAFFEGGHGLVAFGEFVEQFTVGYSAHSIPIREICWRGIVQRRIVAVAFAGVAVTRSALVAIKRADGLQDGVGVRERVLDEFGLFRRGQ